MRMLLLRHLCPCDLFVLEQQGKNSHWQQSFQSVTEAHWIPIHFIQLIEYLFISFKAHWIPIHFILWPGAEWTGQRWLLSSWALYSRGVYTAGSRMMPLLYCLFVFIFSVKSDNCARVFVRKCVGMAPDHHIWSLLSQCGPTFFILPTHLHPPPHFFCKFSPLHLHLSLPGWDVFFFLSTFKS